MIPRWLWFTTALIIVSGPVLPAQSQDSVFFLSAIVYQEDFRPVPASHVINMQTRTGTITDTLGIFRLPVRRTDTILIRNIAFRDRIVPVRDIERQHYVVLWEKYYDLQEVKIFEWGSSYSDFLSAVTRMPPQESLGESMGLPRQDPGYVPMEMQEEAVKSVGYLLSSPVSFFYQNFNRRAKSERKAYWLEKNREKIVMFHETVSRENVASITGLEGEGLERFIEYLNLQMKCDYNCTELQIYSEMYRLWQIYQSHRLQDR